jgi:tRNA U34 5-methylaminomethyl-2-thiouridine-forming methyltransferase MnmC
MKKMEYSEIHKLMEIQYLTGRLDELYKGYVPNYNQTNNRIVDTRISKYEDKLKNLDPVAFHLYKVQHKNVTMAKRKSKAKIASLLSTIKDVLINEFGCEEDNKLVQQINQQLNTY